MAQTKAELEAENAELKLKLEVGTEPSEVGPDDRTVVERILAIAKEVGVLTPEKSGGVPFAFRGIDAVVAKLTPLLNRHGVFATPVDTVQLLSQRDLAGGKVVTKADVTVTYRFYGAKGDFIDAQVVAQADDFADRSSAQAMSVAFRVLLLQTFHIAAFGNEEEFSETTKNARETAAAAKIDTARKAAAPTQTAAPAAPSAPSGGDPAEAMRQAIVAAAGRKGITGPALNDFARDVTGKETEQWWNDPNELNKILLKVNGE